MLVFIISLRSPAVAGNWRIISELCTRTLESCCSQSVDAFRVLLVCNKPPESLPSLRPLTVIAEDFPVPQTKQEQLVDKYRKIQRGLIYARPWAPFYWMKVDADDCVSNRLAEHVASRSATPGWFFPQGYVYSEGASQVYLERRDFFRMCGTSSILFCGSADQLPQSMNQELREFDYLQIPHGELVEFMERVGRPLTALPFPGAVYCTGTGENWSGFSGVETFHSLKWKIRRFFNLKRLTPRIETEFALRPLTPSGGSIPDQRLVDSCNRPNSADRC